MRRSSLAGDHAAVETLRAEQPDLLPAVATSAGVNRERSNRGRTGAAREPSLPTRQSGRAYRIRIGESLDTHLWLRAECAYGIHFLSAFSRGP